MQKYSICLLLSSVITTYSFTVPSNAVQKINQFSSTTKTTTSLNVIPSAEYITDIVHQTSMVLADAAVAQTEDVGKWQSFINIFKDILTSVHSSVDGPLKNMGIEQTWGPSIFLFTAGVRSLLLPLSIQQSKSAEYNRALKPYQDEIRERFKDNKDLMNRAIAKLYEDSGTNPFTGCLFSLLQLPVFLGLYRSITGLAKDELIDEPFLWIPSLQGPVGPPDYRGVEWLTQGWVDGHPALGWETTIAFLIMPIVLVLGQKLTMTALTPETDTDSMSAEEKEQFERTQGIFKFLPLMIGYFSLQVPAGLTIYWFTSNIFTLSQSLAVKAYYQVNPPKIDLPDYWDALDDVASMTPDERRKAAEAGLSTGPSYADMLDEARFHYVVDRKPLRSESDAWNRVSAQGEANTAMPAQMESWVNGISSDVVLNGSSHDDSVKKEQLEVVSEASA